MCHCRLDRLFGAHHGHRRIARSWETPGVSSDLRTCVMRDDPDRSPFCDSILLGSTSHYLVQKSSVPVMVSPCDLYQAGSPEIDGCCSTWLGRPSASQEASTKDGPGFAASRSSSVACRCLYREERVEEAGGRGPRCRTAGKGGRAGRPRQEGVYGWIQLGPVIATRFVGLERARSRSL